VIESGKNGTVERFYVRSLPANALEATRYKIVDKIKRIVVNKNPRKTNGGEISGGNEGNARTGVLQVLQKYSNNFRNCLSTDFSISVFLLKLQNFRRPNLCFLR
jgi:hypothetical protein